MDVVDERRRRKKERGGGGGFSYGKGGFNNKLGTSKSERSLLSRYVIDILIQ